MVRKKKGKLRKISALYGNQRIHYLSLKNFFKKNSPVVQGAKDTLIYTVNPQNTNSPNKHITCFYFTT